MSELIKVSETDLGEKLVSARELYEFLEIQTRFDIWIQRMFEYGFTENQDYTLVAQKRTTNNFKNPITNFTDYALSLDCAKEIAMLQRTAKGK